MKPDGVVTAALEPMETLESNPVNEAAPAVGQEPNQAASPVEEEVPQQPAGEAGQVEPQPDQAKETPAAKTGNKTSGDSKAKTTNKATTKTKPGATSPTKTTSGSRTNTSQSRLSNGVSKPQTNGVAKKTPPAAVKKSTPTTAPTKKPTGPAGSPASKSKVGEKKAPGAAPATNGAKSMTGTTAAKKTPSTNTNGVKTSTTAAAAKKPPAPKSASAPPSKPSSAASPKPPVSKTTRPTTGAAASSRPPTGSTRPPTTSTSKSSPATAKPATPKTSSTTAKPTASKPTSTTPSGGKPPASQTSKNTTPVKKDVTKPATPASKKPAESPLTRPSSTTKSAKPETPKSAITAKKPPTAKAADTKTPNRSKTQDSKTPSKDALKTPGSKTATTKTASPKKTVGSSTPTPVKRGPKASAAEPEKEIAAAVAATAAIATAAAVIAGPEEPEPPVEAAVEPSPAPELMISQTEAVQEKTSDATPEPVSAPVLEVAREPTPEPAREPTPEPAREPTPEPVREPTPEPIRQPTPEPIREPTPEPVREPTPEPMREPTPEPVREPTPEPVREPTPEPVREPTPEPVREPTPEPVREPTPEPVREPTPEPIREPTPEPAREPTPEPVRELTPEPVREPTPEPAREPTPEPAREPTPEPVREVSPEPLLEPLSQPSAEPDLGAEAVHEPASNVQLSAQQDLFKFEESANDSVPSLGTTVMSPPCSPPGPVSPAREQQDASPLLDMHMQSDPWDRNQSEAPSDFAVNVMNFEMEEEKEEKEQFEAQETMEEEEEEEEQEEKENLFMPTSTAPSAEAFNMMAQPHLLGASPTDDFTSGHLISPHEKEEAVEKADEEINEDDDDEEDDDEDEEQRRLGHQPSSLVTDMSTSQPSEEFQVRSAYGGSAGWHGDDLLSGMDSEDVSSCTSSRQHGVSDLSSTQHTAILEGTQSSDALVDSSLRGSEGDGNLMGSPNVETLANEEEEDEDEEDERVDDMDLSSERVEEHHKVFQQQEHDEDEEDEDVEMHSEGVTESCGNADEDDFNEEERLDNLNRSAPLPCVPPTSSWGQTNPFSDPWAQPASMVSVSSPSPVSDHGAAESETPILSPAQARLDSAAPSFAPQSEQELEQHQSAHEEMTGSAPEEEDEDLLAAPAVGMSQPGTLSGSALAAHSSSETSTPEELRDYDSSSGVESHSDKQQTPVPASVQPDMEQDLGIHLEKGDGEEEEAETLPADEVLGTGPPTAPASAPSSPSTSGDEASDTEGEMQINDPDAPVTMDESAGFESPTPTCSLPALEEDEEAGDAAAVEGEEDGGGTTPQSANSVASYGFDCTTSNSNAHSMAESCGKSPGIFSLENEEQLPEEAKDPSLIKELTLPAAAAAAQADDLLGRHVDLMPLGQPGLDEHHYMLGGNIAADHLKELDPLEPTHHLGAQESGDTSDSQPPYYSTICDKTDSFLEGDEKTGEAGEARKLQTHSWEDNWNQNHATAVPIANGHYLAMVPGNRRPIDPTLAAHFAKIASPPSLIETGGDSRPGGEQLRRLEQHQEKLREMQHRQEQERQKRQWLEEERLRLEQQKQLEKQRRELLQLQLQQQQQEHRHRRQVLQWQLELEHQYRMQQKQIQQQQQLRRSPTGVMVSPSSGLCTIYEAMETSDEEDEARGEKNRNTQVGGRRVPSSQSATQDFQRQLRPMPPQELEWNKKVDMVQQLINQTLMLSGDGSCPPLLLLPVGTGGTLSPLESSMWPNLLPQFSPPSATVTSVSSYSPDSQGSSSPGDWTVVEVETQH